MRIYEELFIIRPDATEEQIDQLIEQLTTYIANQGGNVDKVDKWGVRKLAYRVQKRTEGFYVLLQFVAKPETVKELERRLRVSDDVLKFLTVRIDEKLKKIEKRTKAREKRAARTPEPPGRSDQAGAQHRIDPLRVANLRSYQHGSHFKRRRRKAWRTRSIGESDVRLCAQLSVAAKTGRRGNGSEQEDRRAGAAGASDARGQAGFLRVRPGEDEDRRSRHEFAKARCERRALRTGDLQGHRRSARKAGLHHRSPQGCAGGAHQDAGRIQSAAAPAPRSHYGHHRQRRQRRRVVPDVRQARTDLIFDP